MQKLNLCLSALTALSLALTPAAHAQPSINLGLVGVGRISGNAFDQFGPNIDSLGGIGSAIFFDTATWSRTGDALNGYTYHGLLYSAPDRGFGDGSQDYHPRLQIFTLAITPYYGGGVVPQNQVIFSNSASMLLTYDLTNTFTGYDADNLGESNFPSSTVTSLGKGHRSLDNEGLVRTSDGGYFISDEYGPFIYRYDSAGNLQYSMQPPTALIPKRGAYPGTNSFTAVSSPTSGRRNNRGMEGLSMTPDGKRLMAMLQSPTIQDGGAGNFGRITRVLMFDIDPVSVTYRQPVAEYAYQLTLNGSAQTNQNTPVSEIFALNRTQFLVIERDAMGYASLTLGTPTYKRVVFGDLSAATNIINTGYDLERGAPLQLSFNSNSTPANVAPVARVDFIDLIDTNQLVKFGMNINTNLDTNSITEKWEGLALVPLKDPASTNDYLLLVANDNDFKAGLVYHNGVIVGTNALVVDNIILAYRVTLPTYQAVVPPNQPPTVVFTGPTNATLSAPALVALSVTAYDQDGKVVKVEFFEGATKLGEATAFPFALAVPNVAAGAHTYTALCTDNDGATGSATKVVTVTAANLPPTITLLTPTNGFTAVQPVNIAFTASASDADGSISKVEYYRGATKLGQATAAPYAFTATNFVAGTNAVHALAYDNQGATTASTDATVIVLDHTAPVIVCSSNIITSCASADGALVTFVVSATDNNDTNLAVTCTPPSGSLFASGTNVVTCTGHDAAGNPSACSFNVIVLPVLTIERAVILRWNCGQTLQGADSPNGPWSDILGATPPSAVPATQTKAFYRVRN